MRFSVLAACSAVIFTTLSVASAEPSKPIRVRIDPHVNPWTNLEFNNDPENFQFIVVTDRTGGHREGVFEDGIAKINLLLPEFVMSVGDLIEGGTEDKEEIEREWAEFNGFVNRLTMPFFYVPGNHDISNDVMHEEWRKRFGRAYYHFVYRNVLFLCLNTEDPPRTRMSPEQAAYVKKALAENPNVRWTLVFMHKPMWTYEQDTGWAAIEQLLQGRPYTVFAGHTHDYTKYIRHDRRYIVLATMGGSSMLRGPAFGEFDHVAWVTMTDEGPVLANLMLDGIWNEDIYTETNAQLIRPALSGATVRCDPVVVENDVFETCTAGLRLTNDSDVPMHAVVTLNPTHQIQPGTMRIEKTVPPNSVEFESVSLLHVQATKPVETLDPLRVDWVLTYEVPNGQAVEVDGSYRLIIDRSFPMERRHQPVTVDGDLGEWPTPNVVCVEPAQLDNGEQHWTGPGDASFRLKVSYDDSFVYAVLMVTDDSLRTAPGRRPTSQDCVELWVDGRPATERTLGPDDKEGVQFVRFAIVPGLNGVESATEDAGALPPGSACASRLTDSGYTAEVAIPVSYFAERQGGDWTKLRLNAAVYDVDAEFSGPRNVIWWRHGWRSPQNIPQSGTFEKR